MKVYVASDHAGFELKHALVPYLNLLGHQAVDLGAHTLAPQDDYPDFIFPLAREVAKGGSLGIVIGGSGQGEAIAANRVLGARAAVYYGGNLDVVRLAREHNNANILSLGARFIESGEAEEAIRMFIDTPFGHDERHMRRLGKLEQ